MMRQTDRAFAWSDPSEQVLRHIRAADGSPGVRTTLCGLAVSVFDAHPGRPATVSREPSSAAATAPCSYERATARSGSGTPAAGRQR